MLFWILSSIFLLGIPTEGKPNELTGLSSTQENGNEWFKHEVVLRPPKSLHEILGVSTRNLNKILRWPQQIPFEISPLYTSNEVSIIKAAMNEYHEKTCVRFVPRTYQTDYIHITPDDGQGAGVSTYCYSYVGKRGGRQIVKMYAECVRLSAMIHELGHAIGFEHEHNRADRDNYITIQWTNIDPVYHYAYTRVNANEYDTMGLSYDYDSIMHYPDYSFAKPSGVPLKAFTTRYRQGLPDENQRLSVLDVQKINKFFGCV